MIHLVACGSFNPPTLMHLRMLEIARNHFGAGNVSRGTISPVADAYGKAGLVGAKHRLEMCRLAVQGNAWITVDPWEAGQTHWSLTRSVLEHLKEAYGSERMVLVIGSDLANRFLDEKIWAPKDVRCLSTEPFGIIVIPRAGHAVSLKVIERFPSIVVCDEEECESGLSSTMVRQLIAQGKSARYLVSDAVLDYIQQHSLYLSQ